MILPILQPNRLPKDIINTIMNYENHLFRRLEKQSERLLAEGNDPKDTITMDVPLFIRMLELAREDIKSDVELHNVVERTLALKNSGVLTMNNYEDIAGTPASPEIVPKRAAGIDEIRKLAGI